MAWSDCSEAGRRGRAGHKRCGFAHIGCRFGGASDSVGLVSARRTSPGFRSTLLWAAALVAPLAAFLGAANAGDLKGRLAGQENLRPSAYASIAAADKHLWTLREFDPLVPQKYTTIGADPEKDVTIAIYGAGGKEGFGAGQVVRLAGARAIPATVVIPSGVPVWFKNDDPFIHQLVGPGLPEGGRALKPGESHKLEPKEKLTQFTCTQTPSVKIWVVVEDGVIATRWAGHDGALRVADMSAAEYSIKAFFEGNAKVTVPNFKVPATGSVELKEVIQVGPTAAPSGAPGK